MTRAAFINKKLHYGLYGLALGALAFGPLTIAHAIHAKGDPEGGRVIYTESCMHCHGPTGRGDSDMSKYLDPPPANLASNATQAKTDDELRKVIIEGRAGTAMAGFEGAFEDSELIDLVAYIRSLKS